MTKLRTLIMATGSTLALAAPYANAKTTPLLTAAHHKPSAHRAVAKHGSSVAPDGAYVAPFPSWPIVTPRYIYIPAAAANVPVVDDCQTSGNNCTDDQLCDFWGVNCPVYAPTGAPASALPPQP